MAREGSSKKNIVVVGAVTLLTVLGGGCKTLASVEVNPADCINPSNSSTGECVGEANESRILEVRLYQLKQAVDPCKLDLDVFAQGKDLEKLQSALVETQRKDAVRWAFNVTARDPRVVGTWEILAETRYVLAVAIGRGRHNNSVRLIPAGEIRSRERLPTLYIRGFDICLDGPCDATMEKQCP